ncbi:DUF4377 domain-containing protein [Myroides ceti]|uniref:DUF4377 domain-containing protein n=1 Tax=Paenimyroides ceti TaxID=395087 RepID=A0ABT8CUB2_9FLAO|nr:DUF4377 domain-containing protein [Paenimyroides ceti]MDN3706765.1 DUF4377 domain-containing protein [Paenimyroides ceti]
MKKIIYFSLCLMFILTSCSTGNVHDYIIASQQADCTGVAPQKCLLVKKGNATEWEYFYSTIEGFNYEPNYEYRIKVKEEKLANVPADASSIKYSLVKQMSKTAKTSENLPVVMSQTQKEYQCTAKVLEVQKESIGRGAAQGKMEVIVVKMRISSSVSPEIKEGSTVYAELVPSPTVMPVVNREYVFKAKNLHPAHAKGVYLLETNVMDLVH